MADLRKAIHEVREKHDTVEAHLDSRSRNEFCLSGAKLRRGYGEHVPHGNGGEWAGQGSGKTSGGGDDVRELPHAGENLLKALLSVSFIIHPTGVKRLEMRRMAG